MPDFLRAVEAACIKDEVNGIYHLGDDGKLTLQQFLEKATGYWNLKKPWVMPVWIIYSAAIICEFFASIFKLKSPLTRDFIKIGMASYYGDTGRMKEELLPQLIYPTIDEGIVIL